MRVSMLILMVVALVACCSSSASAAVPAAAADGSYVVALAQHVPAIVPPGAGSSLAAIKAANLDAYVSLGATAEWSSPRPQMIVYPEFGLSGTADLSARATTVGLAEPVPDCPAPSCAELGINPSLDEAKWAAVSPALFRGSVIARNTSMLVLINLFETLACEKAADPKCPADGQYIYVTDALFNASGVLVAKYRKSHPFYIFSVNAPPSAELVYFDAEFGVRFGLFICADIAFSDPAVELVQMGVKHFAYAAAIGTIGRDTIAPAWSALHNATLLLSNNGANASAAFVVGHALPAQTVQVPESPDSVIVAQVPIEAGAASAGDSATVLRDAGEKILRGVQSLFRGEKRHATAADNEDVRAIGRRSRRSQSGISSVSSQH